MILIIPSGRSLGVTFVQVLPPSRVRCTKPSSVPTHSRPFWSGDSAKLKMTL